MPTYQVSIENRSPEEVWQIEWDEEKFSLIGPGREMVYSEDTSYAHRMFDAFELLNEEKISVVFSSGEVFSLEASPLVVDELRAFVEFSLRSDVDYREKLRRNARNGIPLGIGMFLVCGSLFGLYCWWASWAADPPPGHWLRWAGWIIHFVLLILIAIAIAGPAIAYQGIKQLRWLKHLERELK